MNVLAYINPAAGLRRKRDATIGVALIMECACHMTKKVGRFSTAIDQEAVV